MTRHDLDELGAYALGALRAGDAATVETHLRTCAGCRRALSEFRRVIDELDGLPPETFEHGPPEGDAALRGALRRIRAARDPGC